MQSIISTSIANVTRFSVEATEMLRNDVLASLRLHLKSYASGLLSGCPLGRKSLTQATTVNSESRMPVIFGAKLALLAGLNSVTPFSGNYRRDGHWAGLKDGRGIDANDHQRPFQFHCQRHG